MVGGIFLRFRATGAFNQRQTPVMKEMVGKSQPVPWKEQVERNENCPKNYFACFHTQPEYGANQLYRHRSR